MKPLRIFLDSRDWIILAKVANGKETSSELIKIYKKIKKMSDSGYAIFPFSMFHLEDLMKRHNKSSRNKVIDVIIDISKGYVLKPFILYKNKEIENAILNRLGINPMHDIDKLIIGKGIAYTAGEEYRVTSSDPRVQKFLDEKDAEIRNTINSIESMKKILKDESYAKTFLRWKKQYETLAKTLQGYRDHKKNWTRTERYNYELAAFTTKSIVPHLVKFLIKLNIPKEKIGLTTVEDIESFLENLPSNNVFLKLTFARDEESSERTVKPNDAIDINHLAGAIPYCDIVVMEKMFANLSKKQKLDKKYNCIVCSSLLEFGNVLQI